MFTAVLVLLDLSTAFDVIDHGIHYERIEHSYGICNDALNWIQSYLSNRTQCVAVGSCTSTDKTSEFRGTTGFGPWTTQVLSILQTDW